MKDPEDIEVSFPLGGIDTSGEFGVQRPNTTPSATNVRGLDPILERERGGSRHGLEKYPTDQIPEGAELIQHLFQLVKYDSELLLSTFEDYQPTFVLDTSSNNDSTRNPGEGLTWGRRRPPGGSGSQPNRNQPRQTRRRLQIVATPTTQTNGTNVSLAVTLTTVDGGAAVASGFVKLKTQPLKDQDGNTLDGNGDTLSTSVSGKGTFTVNEATYEGQVRYVAEHEYVISTPPTRIGTCRGTAIVTWKPAYTLTLSSTDGMTLDADGKSHPLVATLTRTSNGDPIIGRTIQLATSPTGRVGSGVRRVTDGAGSAVFSVSDTTAETVSYEATLVGKSPAGLTTVVSNTVAIDWATVPSFYDFLFTPTTTVPVGTVVLVTSLVTFAGTSAPVDGVVFKLTSDPFSDFVSGSGGSPGVSKYSVNQFFPGSIVFEAASISVPVGGTIVGNITCTVTWV